MSLSLSNTMIYSVIGKEKLTLNEKNDKISVIEKKVKGEIQSVYILALMLYILRCDTATSCPCLEK